MRGGARRRRPAGDPAAARRRAAQERPAGVARQVDVEQDEGRAGGRPPSAARGVLGRVGLDHGVAAGAGGGGRAIERSASSSSTSRIECHHRAGLRRHRRAGARRRGRSRARRLWNSGVGPAARAAPALARGLRQQLVAEAEAGDGHAREARRWPRRRCASSTSRSSSLEGRARPARVEPVRESWSSTPRAVAPASKRTSRRQAHAALKSRLKSRPSRRPVSVGCGPDSRRPAR